MMMIIEYLILIDYQIVTMKLIKMMMMMIIMEFKTNVLLSAAAFCIPPSVPGY